jgi:hypothetical protein
MQIENKEIATITKALIVYAQYLERKTERLEKQLLPKRKKEENV